MKFGHVHWLLRSEDEEFFIFRGKGFDFLRDIILPIPFILIQQPLKVVPPVLLLVGPFLFLLPL